MRLPSFTPANPASAPANLPPPAPRLRVWPDAACALFLALLALAAWLPLLTLDPLPGGDEPGFVDPAATFARHGFVGTALYVGQLPGMERHVYWQPPLYFVLLGLWLKAFGVGLAQARLFSVLCGIVVVLCAYRLARFWTTALPSLGASSLCALSVWVAQDARLARMDELCAACTLLCAVCYISALRRQEADARATGYLLGTGLCAGLAVLAHPLGIAVIVAVAAHMAWRRRPLSEWAQVLLPWVLCMVAWGIYIAQDAASFRAQIGAQQARRALYAEPPFWYWFLISKLHVWTLLILLVAGAGAVRRARRLPTGAGFAVLLTVIALVAATYGRLPYYFALFVPLLCVLLALCLQFSTTKRWAGIGLATALCVEIVGTVHALRQARGHSYAGVTAQLRAAVPPGQSVFCGFSYLSPYFALQGRNPLRMAAPVPLPPGESLRKAIAGCDYLVVPVPLIGNGLRPWVDGYTPVAIAAGGTLAVYRLPKIGAARPSAHAPTSPPDTAQMPPPNTPASPRS